MTPPDDHDIFLADIVEKFTDESGPIPNESFMEAFLQSYPDLQDELRPLLRTVLTLKSAARAIRIDQKRSDELFGEITRRLAKPAKKRGLVLDRRSDFILFLLHFMKKTWGLDVWGKTKLVKLLLLMGKEGGCDQFMDDFYDHYAYSYGAFDKNVPKDADALSKKGFIKMAPMTKSESKSDSATPKENRVDAMYRLTPKGEKIVSALLNNTLKTNPSILSQIETVIKKHGKKSTEELLSYTYKTYPETAIHSKVKDKYQ